MKPVAIGALVLLAAFLRCYHLSEIPLTNDELSALDRLRFASFSELISKGVMPDGHPALVQVFLFYYTKLTGLSPVLIKLPFILCGIAGVYVAYRVFSRMFNESTGLLVAAFMAASQFFIMHSQTARPYAPALLFVLLLLQQLLAVADGETRKKHYVLITILLTLLASTHYLALLTGVVLALFFLWHAGQSRKHLLIAYACSAVLYIPQLPVFWQQLQVGGIGLWLGKPQPGFIIDFFRYLVQFNTIVLLLSGAGIIVSLYLLFAGGVTSQQRKKMGIVLGSFVITYGVLYLYSVLRNPLLQFPSLLFAAPCLLAFAFYPATLLPRAVYASVLVVFTTVQVYALTVSRRHYEVFYHQGYKAAVEAISTHATSNTPLLLNGNEPYYFDFYFKRAGFKPNVIHTRIDSLSYTAFDSLLQTIKQDTIVVAHAFGLPLEYFSMARNRFPDSIYCEQHAFNETWILARKKGWTLYGPMVQFGPEKEYGVPVEFTLSGPLRFRLEAYSNIMQPGTGSAADPELALSVKNSRNEPVYWRSNFYHSFNPEGRAGGKIFVASDIVIPAKDTFRFAVFMINGKKESFMASQPKVRVSRSNRLLLGTIEPLEE